MCNIFDKYNNIVLYYTTEIALYFYKNNAVDLFYNTNNFENYGVSECSSIVNSLQDNDITNLHNNDNNTKLTESTNVTTIETETKELPTPRYWQSNVLNELDSTNSTRIMVNAPTGAGKAFFLMFIILQAIQSNKRCILLVDRLQLLKQLQESAKVFNFDFNILTRNIKDYSNKMLTIGMMQTFNRMKDNIDCFDVILVDECHTIYKPFISYLESFNGRLIGVTATPYVNGIKDVYKHIIQATTQQELTKNNILVPIQVYQTQRIDMQGCELLANEYQAQDVHGRCADIYGDIKNTYVNSIQPHHKKVLVFCANVNHCKDVANEFDLLNIKNGIYNSKISKQNRDAVLHDFDNSDDYVLITVSALAKGFDRGCITAIIDLRPLNSSLAEYIQMLGRGIRTNTNKTHCDLYDFSGNWSRFGDKYLEMYKNGSTNLLNEYADKVVNNKKTTKNSSCKTKIKPSNRIITTEETKIMLNKISMEHKNYNLKNKKPSLLSKFFNIFV